MTLWFFFENSFPKFWAKLQEELDVNDDDFTEIKSIFSALGYMTSPSIASIKTKKNLGGLESEYIKMRSNTKTLEAVCRQ